METAGNDQFDDDTEKKGLGTPATRAGIIEKLVKSGFAERKGKSLIPTKDGCNLVCVLPEQITSPAMTAEWENTLTLECLKRGGRISKTAAFAGGVLNIKPVLSVIDGEIHLLGKARGSKMGNNLLVQEIDKAGGIDFSRPVLLGYSGISDALLLKYIEDSRHIWEGKLKEIRYTTVGSVIGTHAGPGAVVVAFFKNQ